MFDLFVKWTVDDNPKRAFLWVSGSRSKKENNSSLESSHSIKFFGGDKDTASLRYWNRMGPFKAKRFGIMGLHILVVSISLYLFRLQK